MRTKEQRQRNLEQRLRRQANKIGYKLCKDGDTYMLVERSSNTVASYPAYQDAEDITENLLYFQGLEEG